MTKFVIFPLSPKMKNFEIFTKNLNVLRNYLHFQFSWKKIRKNPSLLYFAQSKNFPENVVQILLSAIF